MDPGVVVAIMVGIVTGGITLTSIFRHRARNRHPDQSGLEDVRAAVLEDLRKGIDAPGSPTGARIAELESNLNALGERIEELSEENRFLRRLLEEKDEEG